MDHTVQQSRATTHFDVVAIAASLGGPQALRTLLRGLPADFPSAILVVQHRSASYPSFLAHLLQQSCALNVTMAEQEMTVHPGTIYIAPPDRHLLVEASGTLALSTAPAVQFSRPSANLLFASVAEAYGPRAIGVVLTGKQADGAIGAWAIKAMGGRILVQDAATSVAFDMPSAAISSGSVDFVLPLERIAPALITLTMVPGAAPMFVVPPAASLARARQSWIA